MWHSVSEATGELSGMRVPLLVVTVALAGCCSSCMQTDEHGGTAALLDQVPVERVTLPGRYVDLANCAYPRLDKASGTGLKKVDLQNEARLALESGGVRYWELTFAPAGAERTLVAFTQAQTMWGPLGAKEVMPIVRSCAA
jgi:hypothetical protein